MLGPVIPAVVTVGDINTALQTSPGLQVRDNRFTLQDDGDTTKQAQFQCSGITAGQTRTLTIPDASTTLAGLAVAQTFTAAQTIALGTISADTQALSLTATWNNAGVTFGGALKVNVTDTASAAASLLADLQVGGTSKVKVSKTGHVTINLAGSAAAALTAQGISCLNSGANCTFEATAYSGSPLFLGTRYGGTPGSESAVQSGDSLFLLGGAGRAATGVTGSKTLIAFKATENWTDTANGCAITLETTPNGSTTRSEKFRIDGAGNIVLGTQAALGTSATDGFTYAPSCAGAPSGTPTAYTGMVPLIVDTTNGRLYAYYGGAWHFAAFT